MADAEDKLLNVDDDEVAGESTVAMASPSFDPTASGMPSPISNPPPGFVPGNGPPPLQMPQTAPVPFTPPAPAVAAPPKVGVPTPAPPVASPGPAAPIATPQATPAFPTGSLRRGGRAQTVIGIAPPAPGAKSPPSPLGPPAFAAPISSPQAGAQPPIPPSGPIPTPPRPMAPVAPKGPPPRPGTLVGTGLPGLPSASASAPPSKPVAIGVVDDIPPWDDVPDSHKEDSPTMAGSTEESLALFGVNEGAARGPGPAAGRPITSPFGNPPGFAPPPPPASRPSPSRPGTSGGLRPALGQPDKENETVAVVQSDLDSVRRAHEPDEEESTRAVPREELLRGQDAQFIVGDDATGDDATLAIAPGANEASRNIAAFAETMQGDPNLGSPLGGPAPGPGNGPPQQGWGDPNAGWGGPPVSHGMGAPWGDPNAPPSNQHPHPPSSPNHYMPPSSGHMQGSNPHMMAPPGQMQVPSSGHMQAGPGSQRGFNQPNNPIPYPAHMVHGQQGSPWLMSGPGGRRFKISGQILLLAVVGFVCLAVFITGIVLFATTKL